MVIFLLLVCVSGSFARSNHCGTSRLIQYNKELLANPSLGISAKVSDAGSCTADDLYDSVYTRETEHFQIFYTLSGPHKTTQVFIDSLAKFAEFAYDFHTKKMNMRAPLGYSTTLHYQKNVTSGLYPIEVLDIDNLRDARHLIGGICHGCYGVAIPKRETNGVSELIIENDFLYTPTLGIKKDTVNFNGKKCTYNRATEELRNEAHNYSYAKQWNMALRVTTIHELYHAVQLRYLDLYQHSTFWFEASASGIEEIAAPDIDDYFAYLPNFFKQVGTSLDDLEEDYGAGILLMYLYNHLDKNLEKYIWEQFYSNPNKTFQQHLQAFCSKKKISIDSLFLDFSKKLAFSGTRAPFLDSTQWVVNDQHFWPDLKFKSSATSTQTFVPSENKFAFDFHINGKPILDDYKGSVSAILFKGKAIEIQDLPSISSVDSLFMEASLNPMIDSIGWIFSRFTKEEPLPIEPDTSSNVKTNVPLHAFPTPWRAGNLCFTPLPENRNYIEIRNRRGDLIAKETYDGKMLCLDETTVKSLMVPGVYGFRAGNSGKLKDILIIY